MLVLFETPAGYALFKVLNEGKLASTDMDDAFSTPQQAGKMIKLKAFRKFENTAEALAAATAIVDGTLDSDLKKFLKKEIDDASKQAETLAIADSKLGAAIAKKLGIKVVSDSSVNELMRGIRSQLATLITGLPESEMNAMSLGLSHSLSRYKLKFSPDKVDTMIVQAIGLLDDLDKELNTYAMRAKEWFGWHFPEMTKVIVDNVAYCKCVLKMQGQRERCSETSFDDILPEDLEKELKEIAEISMGTEISALDIATISHLCEQVLSLTLYRAQLYDYLKNRMNAIAPNLTVLVGDLVGARLISHAGSLLNLAKQPASTIQILGAEKALFRALKTKKDTPKYGLIYHASLVGQAGLKTKGKMARMLAAKAALATRVDALTDAVMTEDGSAVSTDNVVPDLGIAQREKLENQLRRMDGKSISAKSTPVKKPASPAKSSPSAFVKAETLPATYNAGVDSTIDSAKKKEKKAKKEKKEKKAAEEAVEAAAMVVEEAEVPEVPEIPEVKQESEEAVEETKEESKEKKKEKKEKKKRRAEEIEEAAAASPAAAAEEVAIEKKPKKSKKSKSSE